MSHNSDPLKVRIEIPINGVVEGGEHLPYSQENVEKGLYPKAPFEPGDRLIGDVSEVTIDDHVWRIDLTVYKDTDFPNPRDPATLNRVTHFEIQPYLSANGWMLYEEFLAGVYSVWIRDDHELFVPILTNLPDYPYRIYDILHTLSQVEKRSETAILIDILSIHRR